MATKLTDIEISEVSLVDEPANDEARVVVVKAKGGMKPCADCEDEKGCMAKGKCGMKKSMDGDEDDANGDSDPEPKMKKGLRTPMAKVAGAVLAALEELTPQIVEKALAGFSADPNAAEMAAFVMKETVMDLSTLQTALAEAEATIATLNKRAADAEAEAAAKEDIIKAKDAEIERLTAADEGGEDDVLKSLPEPIRKRIEAAEAKAKAAEEAIAKAKAEAEEQEAIAKARDLKIGDAAKLGPLLLRVAKGRSGEADAKELEALLKSAGEVTSKSPLFKSVGSAAAVEGDPEALLVAKAKEIEAGSKGTLTYAQAYDRALNENPDLYTAYINKRRQTAA